MAQTVLTLNAGSSSLKFGLFERSAADKPNLLLQGKLRFVDSGSGDFSARQPGRAPVQERWTRESQSGLLQKLLEWVDAQPGGSAIVAVGHRIVHGGAHFQDPVEIDGEVLARLEELTPLAPLHQPPGLAPVRQLRTLRPALRQIACFDTAFHRGLRPPASRYALPRSFEEAGIRRYGFHGLSYESIAGQLVADADAAAPDSRIVVAHLGNGASLCAMRGLSSVDTTMGFSTLDGLVMGTRAGALDPGILLYLLREKGYSGKQLERLLYRESGLLGVSGISPDVQTLLDSDVPAAAEALDLFAYQVARQAAALAATLGGIDRFVFTGGIGENAPAVRAMIARRLEWLGAQLDEEANAANAMRLSAPASKILLERRSTDEELAIAGHVFARLRQLR